MAAAVYQFGEFCLHCGHFQLSRKGRRLKLERKPFELLVLLVTHHGQVVTRDEIAQQLWEQQVFVDVEHGINTAIRKIRLTLDDSPDLPRFVQTLSGSGYRFIATVTTVQPAAGQTQTPDAAVESLSHTPGVALPEVSTTQEMAASGSALGSGRFRYLPVAVRFRFVPHMLVACISLGLLASGFVGYRSEYRSKYRSGAASENVKPNAAGSLLLVLPLHNAGEAGDAYLADAMTEELTTSLSRYKNLSVVSLTTARWLAKDGTSIPALRRSSGAGKVLEGSVFRDGTRVRLDLRLIDTATDRPVWSQQFEPEQSGTPRIASDASRVVTSTLGIRPAASDLARTQQPETNSTEAYDAYLRGEYFLWSLIEHNNEGDDGRRWMRSRRRSGLIRVSPQLTLAWLRSIKDTYMPVPPTLSLIRINRLSRRRRLCR